MLKSLCKDTRIFHYSAGIILVFRLVTVHRVYGGIV